ELTGADLLLHLDQLPGGALGGDVLVEVGHDHGALVHAMAPILVEGLVVGYGLNGVLKVHGPVDAGADEGGIRGHRNHIVVVAGVEGAVVLGGGGGGGVV